MTAHGKKNGPESEYTLEGDPCMIEVSEDSEAGLLSAAQAVDREIPDDAIVRVHAFWVIDEEEVQLYGHIGGDECAKNGYTMTELAEEIEGAAGDPETTWIRLSLIVEYDKAGSKVRTGFPLASVPLCYLDAIEEGDFNFADADGPKYPESKLLVIEGDMVGDFVVELSALFDDEEGFVAVRVATEEDNDAEGTSNSGLTDEDVAAMDTFGN